MNRIPLILIVLVLCVAPLAAQEPATRPAAADDGAVMARVHGKPIPMKALTDILIRGYGMPIAQLLIADELVSQAAAKQGVSVTEEEVRAEHDRVLDRMFGRAISGIQREEGLKQIIQQRGLTREQWDLTMRRNALLRKMAEPKIEITEEILQAEFKSQYGRNVIVSLIQTATLGEARNVMGLARKGADFAELAKRYSRHPTGRSGGQLPPLGPRTTGIAANLRDVAVAMEKEGEISSPVQVGASWHVLRLDKIVQPKDIRFEDVKDKLRKEVYERQMIFLQQTMLMEMIREAEREGGIEYVDPILKTQSQERSEP